MTLDQMSPVAVAHDLGESWMSRFARSDHGCPRLPILGVPDCPPRLPIPSAAAVTSRRLRCSARLRHHGGCAKKGRSTVVAAENCTLPPFPLRFWKSEAGERKRAELGPMSPD